ncbi:hypothetical protein ONQ60_26115, partial [Salmonella enterica subsp. enterica serovar Virginia]|nr:hypothetical protein [Salmonella enterica subsp. enterica serovar Virginia]
LIVQFFTWYLVVPELLPEDLGMWFKAELDPNIQFFLSSMICLFHYKEDDKIKGAYFICNDQNIGILTRRTFPLSSDEILIPMAP